jgi:membrane protein
MNGPLLRHARAGVEAARAAPPVRWFLDVVQNFFRDDCLLRASALTTSAMLALIPLLAIVLAFLQGAGFEQYLRPLLLDRFPVLSPEAVDQMLGYIGRANAQALGGIGFAALLISAWGLFENVERSLNAVFGAPKARSLFLRGGEYLAMLLAGTILLILVVSLPTLVRSETLVERFLGERVASQTAWAVLRFSPWVVVWGGFTVLYSWMPNLYVPWRSALAGGLVGGTLFELLQIAYIGLQVSFSRYHAIYGALAQLPILVVWMFLAWAIVLLGAEAAARTGALRTGEDPAARRLDGIAWTVLREVLAAFAEGRATPHPRDIAAQLGCPVGEVQRAVEPLVRARVIVEPGDGHGYLPARAPSAISAEDLVGTMRVLARPDEPPAEG